MSLPSLQIFDSMRSQKRELIPLEPGHVKLYVCGMTVYDLAHIGHARVYISFDVITRYLRHRGYKVTYVRNFTDIDDKIIARAAERDQSPLELANHFIGEFTADLDTLSCLPPDKEPRVTTHIPEIISLISDLIERGHAYAAAGDVYFEVSTFPEYGKLSGQRLDEMRAGERVASDPRKRSPHDFALWKAARPGEPEWESPWGPGRPGWHIECSAMSATHLSPSFDLHGGGKDLTFPHHENEIAQSECGYGQPYANSWMHVGLVQIDGEKMSKSLNNFWTIRDVLELWHPEAVRFFLLSAHYRKPINYSEDNLDIGQDRLEYAYQTLASLAALWEKVEKPEADKNAGAKELEAFHAGMDDDFNTPVALATVHDLCRQLNERLATKKLGKKPEVLATIAGLEAALRTISSILAVLELEPGAALEDLRLRACKRRGIEPADVEAQIQARKAARDDKDWQEADRIREGLEARGVELMDSPEGTTWRVRLSDK